jgi:hypothetical protein
VSVFDSRTFLTVTLQGALLQTSCSVAADYGGTVARIIDDYGVLTKRRLVVWIGALVLAAVAIAVLLGFVGAGHGASLGRISTGALLWLLIGATGAVASAIVAVL